MSKDYTIKRGLKPNQVEAWLKFLGFKRSIAGRGKLAYRKGKVIVILGKLKAIVKVKLDEPIYRRIPVRPYTLVEWHMRVGGAYYKHITADEFGLHGLGMQSNAPLAKMVYGDQERPFK